MTARRRHPANQQSQAAPGSEILRTARNKKK